MSAAGPAFSGPTYAFEALALMRSWGDDEALVDAHGVRFTYAQVADRTLAMATGLWQHGVASGQTIGVYAINPAESIFLQLGAHLMGVRTAWTQTTAPMRFRHDFIRLAGIDAFVYDARNPTFSPQGAELARLAAPVPVLCFGSGAGPDLLAVSPAEPLPFDAANVPAEPYTLTQTGGTTGLPKLVQHRHGLYAALLAFGTAYRASGVPKLRHLLQSGTWHISSQVAAFMTLFSGGTLFLKEGLANKDFLDLIRDERINSAFVAPPGLYQLLDDTELMATADTSTLATLTVSGAPAAPTRLSAAAERLGPIVRIVYGMSECPMITAMPDVAYDAEHPDRLASCGLPFGDTRIEIRDDDGKSLPTGEIGEIWVSSAMCMSGYFAAPELTASTLIDGWMRTGDVGRLDDDGYLYIVDRAKDMIITGVGSSNVYSRPVEDVLLSHPDVRAAAVIGVPDVAFGERVHAYYVTAPGASITTDEVREFTRARLNERWTPTSWEVIAELPLTISGKIDKKALRERFVATTATGGGIG